MVSVLVNQVGNLVEFILQKKSPDNNIGGFLLIIIFLMLHIKSITHII